MNKFLKFWNYLPSYLVLVVLVFTYAYMARFGMDFTDAPYHLSLFPEYLSHAHCFLAYAIWDTVEVFNPTKLLFYRYVNYGILLCTLLLPIILIPEKKKQFLILCWGLTFSLGLVGVGYTPGYDTISTFFIILCSVCLLKFLQSKKLQWLIISAIAAGLAACSRIPNIVLIALVPTILISDGIFQGGNLPSSLKKSIIDSCIWVIIAALSAIICTLLYYGSISSYLENLSIAAGSGHGIKNMLLRYAVELCNVLKYMIFIAISIYALKYIYRFNQWIFAAIVLVIIAGVLFFLHGDTYGFMLRNQSIALIMCFILIAKLYKKPTFALVLACVLLSTAHTAGSDTGLLKYKIFIFMPFLLFLIAPRIQDYQKFILYSFLICVTCYGVYKKAFRNTYEDVEARLATVECQQDFLKGIYSSRERVEGLQALEKAIHTELALGNSIQFYGITGQIVRLLAPSKDYFRLPFSLKFDDSTHITDFTALLQACSVPTSVIIVKAYPPKIKSKYTLHGIDKALESMHYQRIHTDSFFAIYRKAPSMPQSISL